MLFLDSVYTAFLVPISSAFFINETQASGTRGGGGGLRGSCGAGWPLLGLPGRGPAQREHTGGGPGLASCGQGHAVAPAAAPAGAAVTRPDAGRRRRLPPAQLHPFAIIDLTAGALFCVNVVLGFQTGLILSHDFKKKQVGWVWGAGWLAGVGNGVLPPSVCSPWL
jgi:hypothetical protein